MNDSEKPVTRVTESYKAAVHAKDVGAFMSLYDANVRVFDAWEPWSYEGSGAWQRAVEGWFGALGNERVQVTFDDVQSADAPGLTVVNAIVTYAGISAGGEQLREMQNRITWALRTTGHVSKIVHEHTSAPIGSNDFKAILQRRRFS